MNDQKRYVKVKDLQREVEETRQAIEALNNPSSGRTIGPVMFLFGLLLILASFFILDKARAEGATVGPSPLPDVMCEAHPRPSWCA